MTNEIVRFSNVTKIFQGHRAIDSLSVNFSSGRTIGLLGPNGAGKSTCLKMMLGMTRPVSGSISVFDGDVFSHGPEIRQQIGYVPEDPWLYPWMSVRQVIRFTSSLYHRWDDTLAENLRVEFNLPADRAIRRLSKGMRVKAALLVALAHRPRLLVLDEPMSGLDPLARDELIEILVSFRSNETECLVLSSNQIDDVTRLADEVVILKSGRLVLQSGIDELLGNTKRVEAVLLDGRFPQQSLPQTIWQSVDRRNWSMTLHPFEPGMIQALQEVNPITSATVVDLGLEQIFKDLIRGEKNKCCAP